MKVLDVNRPLKEFHEDLQEGLEFGFILADSQTLTLMAQLYNNLDYYFTYFKAASENAEKES